MGVIGWIVFGCGDCGKTAHARKGPRRLFRNDCHRHYWGPSRRDAGPPPRPVSAGRPGGVCDGHHRGDSVPLAVSRDHTPRKGHLTLRSSLLKIHSRFCHNQPAGFLFYSYSPLGDPAPDFPFEGFPGFQWLLEQSEDRCFLCRYSRNNRESSRSTRLGSELFKSPSI